MWKTFFRHSACVHMYTEFNSFIKGFQEFYTYPHHRVFPISTFPHSCLCKEFIQGLLKCGKLV